MTGVNASARDMLHACKEYETTQWEPLEKVLNQKWELHPLLLWSDKHIPLYKQCFKQTGVTPEKITSLEDFRKPPLHTREDLVSTEINGRKTKSFPAVAAQTSGTSGCRQTIWLSPTYGSMAVFPLWRRALKALGLQPQDSLQQICTLGRGAFPTLGRTIYIDLQDTRTELLTQIMSSQPNALCALPATMEYLSIELLKTNTPPPTFLKYIFTVGEQATASTRKLINTAFHCAPADLYAATEISSGIAWQCEEQEGYHVNIDNLIVEVLDSDGYPAAPGQEGRVVVTDLSSRPVPLIRYEIGDLASWQETPCGCCRTLSCLASIGGRKMKRLVLQNGEWLTVQNISGPLASIFEVMQHQAREELDGFINVDVVLAPNSTAQEILARARIVLMKSVLSTIEWKLNPVLH